MKITESRTKELLHWLDGMTADHTLLFEEMALFRDTAALIRQLQAAEQAAWHSGLDAGRAHPSPSVPVGVERSVSQWRSGCISAQEAMVSIPQQPPSVSVGVDANELTGVRARLKSGDYDGADVMRAWLAIDKLLAQKPAALDGESVEQVASAIAIEDTGVSWHDVSPRDRTHYVKLARAALAAQPEAQQRSPNHHAR